MNNFFVAVESVLHRKLNPPQLACIKHPEKSALMIVAGPGSGKTTVLVLRALRHMLVDGMLPEQVLITTFTRKAAAELRSRLIGWGLSLVEHFQKEANNSGNVRLLEWLNTIDVNQCQTGTLDSFCQLWLGATRPLGSPNPIMLEEFAANFIYRRKIFRPLYASTSKPDIDQYFQRYTFGNQVPRNQGAASGISENINSRLIQDLVDHDSYVSAPGADLSARQIQGQLLSDYRAHLKAQTLYDFSLCAEEILTSLRDGILYPNPSIPEIKALLIDEYQDTNPLQEAIYFELAKRSDASVAVVGDDDQALYRFRGATVELFTNFQARFAAALPEKPSHIEYLATNHRSTPQIIDFFNSFVSHDPDFSPARVAGKPPISKHNPDTGIPILGMFRDSIEELAEDLASLLHQTFKGSGYLIPGTDKVLKCDPSKGALGDAVLLASSVREYKDDGGGRLPVQLRESLARHDLGVFNPRGQDLRDLPRVQILLGLLVLCLDKSDQLEQRMYLTNDAKNYIDCWRRQGLAYIDTRPAPQSGSQGLQSFVAAWRSTTPTPGNKWPEEIPLLDLFYKLIVWLPEFQNDPEHLVYLEAILRCVAQGANYSAYGFSILHTAPHDEQSRVSVFSDLLAPIAERVVDIDEDLLFAIPRSRLSVMTIHQSKGLEFPLVIVDVGSDFKTNHAKQRFRRFPNEASSTVAMETDMAAHTPIGNIRTVRSDMDRTFDDLMRLYYVAYSRPQSALLLVGHTKCVEYGTSVQNIATFWTRQGSWSWRNNPPLKRGTPPYPEKLPLKLL